MTWPEAFAKAAEALALIGVMACVAAINIAIVRWKP